MDDKAKEVIDAYEKVTGITPRIQKTPGKPGEILEKNEDKPIMHEQYRSVLGKLMFYVSKISPECSLSQVNSPVICIIQAKSIGRQWTG